VSRYAPIPQSIHAAWRRDEIAGDCAHHTYPGSRTPKSILAESLAEKLTVAQLYPRYKRLLENQDSVARASVREVCNESYRHRPGELLLPAIT
jgi:hypothetical protein